MGELVVLCLALCIGHTFKRLGLPTLVGYLTTGFLIHYLSDSYLNISFDKEMLKNAAHIGVLILLFTVGLKIDFSKIFKKEILGTTIIHFVLSTVVSTPFFYYFTELSLQYAILLASLLTLSSTVLAARVLETKLEIKSYHGRIAIGMLIFQDLIAMGILSLYGGQTPSIWALSVLTFPLIKPLIYKIIDLSGHDEQLLLTVIILALGVGGLGFHAVGLSGELGALVFGALLAKHDKANEISEKLWGLKELCLVAFFLSIGMRGLPTYQDAIFASLAFVTLPLQGILLFALLVTFKLKSRPAFLTTITLTNFSEFGIIVSAIVLPECTVMIALAVTFSFFVSAPLNRFAHPAYDKLELFLKKFEKTCQQPDDTPMQLGSADVIIIGMGRVGRSAYSALQDGGVKLLGLDSDNEKIIELKEKGYNVLYADGEHGNFWENVRLNNIKACVLCMNCSEATIIVTQKLRKRNFGGYIIAHSHFKDEAELINQAGADDTYLTYAEAGQGIASHTLAKLT